MTRQTVREGTVLDDVSNEHKDKIWKSEVTHSKGGSALTFLEDPLKCPQ